MPRLSATSPSGTGRDYVIAAVVFAVLMSTALYYNYPQPRTQNANFAWEYGNTAESLALGQGFSNPFNGVISGPTAWMPPFYVYFLACIFHVFGVKTTAAMWAVLACKYLAISLCFFIFLRLVDLSGYRRFRYVLIPAFFLPVYLNRTTFFMELHDVWLRMFLSCVLLFTYTCYVREGSRKSTLSLFVLAAILPLADPAILLAFLVVVGGHFVVDTLNLSRHKLSSPAPDYCCLELRGRLRLIWRRHTFVTLVLILIIFSSSTTWWSYRNFRMFHSFIPIKSNLWFDYYQANELDDDGLVTLGTLYTYNPSHVNSVQKEFIAKGEGEFTRDYRRKSSAAFRTHAGRTAGNIMRRAVSALIYMHNSNDLGAASEASLALENERKLREAHLLGRARPPGEKEGGAFWTSLGMPESEFVTVVGALNLTGESAVIEDWRTQRKIVRKRNRRVRIIAKNISVSLLPSLALISGFFITALRRNVVFVTAAGIYVVYLAPYVLVSHYLRYQTPLIGLQSLFISLLICGLLDRAVRRT